MKDHVSRRHSELPAGGRNRTRTQRTKANATGWPGTEPEVSSSCEDGVKGVETEKWSATGRWVRWGSSGANSAIAVFFNMCFLCATWKLPGLGDSS